ncbi:MAG TPA: hypothetical protein VFZ65_10535 [Planctomycetota bacterium]|nr:hypothetical protein [Planctomycetota bacterium]
MRTGHLQPQSRAWFADDWSTFHCKSMLGEALLGQQRLVEAEPQLLDGHRRMQEHEANVPTGAGIHIRDALERLVRLPTPKGDATAVAAWHRGPRAPH